MTVVTSHTNMVQVGCYNCNMPFLIPEWLNQQCLETGRSYYCPSCGRGTMYTESELNRLKQQLSSAEKRAESWMQFYDGECARHEHTEARRRATKGQLTRIRKRASVAASARVANVTSPINKARIAGSKP